MEGCGLKVVLATPTRDKPHPGYVAALEASASALDAAGFEHQCVYEVGCPYISAARATCLRKALDARADVIVFIDDDMGWRPSDLVRLIESDADVCAGLYRFKKPEVEYMGVIQTAPDGIPMGRARDGLILADRVPAGFLKVTKDAVNRFMGAYPELVFGPRYSPSIDLFNHGAHEGVWWGEDYAFSRRWRAMGEKLWVMPDADLTHWGKPCVAHEGNFHKFLMAGKDGTDNLR